MKIIILTMNMTWWIISISVMATGQSKNARLLGFFKNSKQLSDIKIQLSDSNRGTAFLYCPHRGQSFFQPESVRTSWRWGPCPCCSPPADSEPASAGSRRTIPPRVPAHFWPRLLLLCAGRVRLSLPRDFNAGHGPPGLAGECSTTPASLPAGHHRAPRYAAPSPGANRMSDETDPARSARAKFAPPEPRASPARCVDG